MTHHDELLAEVHRLDATRVRALAASWREWRDVVVAAVDDAVRDRPDLSEVTAAVREAFARHDGAVAPTDLEDATMAAWAHALADASTVQGPVTDLLREPWRSVAPLEAPGDHPAPGG